MQIECMTTRAGAEVVFLLLDSKLRPGLDFHAHDPYPLTAPIRFTLHVDVSAHMLRELHNIADAIIQEVLPSLSPPATTRLSCSKGALLYP